MEFSSEEFYNGELQSGIEAKDRKVPEGINWPNPQVPVAFVEVSEEEQSEGDSKLNSAEAEQVMRVVHQAMNAGGLQIGDIGVVTPYAAQVRVLRRMLRPLLPP